MVLHDHSAAHEPVARFVDLEPVMAVERRDVRKLCSPISDRGRSLDCARSADAR
jgi:hypothetical protein